MKINQNKNVIEIDLSVNATYTVKNGELKPVDSPPLGFGKQIITWADGKPVSTELSYTKKV